MHPTCNDMQLTVDFEPSWLVKINRKGEPLSGNRSHNNDIHVSSGSLERNLSRCCYCKNLTVGMGRLHVISQRVWPCPD